MGLDICVYPSEFASYDDYVESLEDYVFDSVHHIGCWSQDGLGITLMSLSETSVGHACAILRKKINEENGNATLELLLRVLEQEDSSYIIYLDM